MRLHVESPRYEDDPELNGIKQELISALLSAELETAVHESGFGYELGRRLSDLSIQRYKCSEVFRVVVQDARSQGSHAANIRMVHNAVGGIVEGVLERFRNRVGDRLPQVTTLNR
ncbi:MAG: hypothetical protein CVT60_00040 [Actinobacteria bacterium HGW-Actinobacteria-10]|nr:MAG: hypothetical protein CVT60_00040 [Actinobacteria bacterium HGW-Actinobacteria-10]